MTDGFGSAGVVGHRMPMRRSRITAELVLDLVTEAAPELETAALRIRVLDQLGSDPMLSVEEGERRVRIDVAELARDMELARVVDTRDGVRAAFRSWIEHRPVTDADAATAGIAVCGWDEPDRTTIAWQVVVARRDGVATWHPSVLMTPTGVAATRADAQTRSLKIPVDMHVAGAAVVWTCVTTPALSTAALVAPERLLLRLTRRGLPTDDVHLVLAPPNPFVSARGPVARRLAGESNQPHLTLPWASVDTLGWG